VDRSLYNLVQDGRVRALNSDGAELDGVLIHDVEPFELDQEVISPHQGEQCLCYGIRKLLTVGLEMLLDPLVVRVLHFSRYFPLRDGVDEGSDR
jgi:hypothetical protein